MSRVQVVSGDVLDWTVDYHELQIVLFLQNNEKTMNQLKINIFSWFGGTKQQKTYYGFEFMLKMILAADGSVCTTDLI